MIAHLFAWKGKIFDREKGQLINEVGPFGHLAVPAKMYLGESWLDQRPAIVLDYSAGSMLAKHIRDEIRSVAPGLYLGIAYWDEDKVLNFSLQFKTTDDLTKETLAMTDPGPSHPSTLTSRSTSTSCGGRTTPSRPASTIDSAGPHLPKLLGLFDLVGIRNVLREHNLHDTSRQPSVGGVTAPDWDPKFETQRTVDGSWNDLANPTMGMAGTRFGRNVADRVTWPDEDKLLEPNPRTVSRRLMTRDELLPATAGNALDRCVAPVHDPRLVQARPQPDREPVDAQSRTGRRLARATAAGAPDAGGPDHPARQRPPADVHQREHALVGRLPDLRQQRRRSRSSCGHTRAGRLRLVDGHPPIPDDPAHNPTLVPGFWLGLGMMQTLFVHEHNSVCEMLAKANPTGTTSACSSAHG